MNVIPGLLRGRWRLGRQFGNYAVVWRNIAAKSWPSASAELKEIALVRRTVRDYGRNRPLAQLTGRRSATLRILDVIAISLIGRVRKFQKNCPRKGQSPEVLRQLARRASLFVAKTATSRT